MTQTKTSESPPIRISGLLVPDMLNNNHKQDLISLLLGLLLAALALALPEARAASESDPEALALATKVYDRPSGRDSVALVTMNLKGKNRAERVRELVTFSLDLGDSERWSLMRFSLPADVKDTGLLTLDHPGDDSDQWIYLPALDRVRIISSKRKGGRFVGSDFTYEDLRDREPDMDYHQFDGKAKVGGLECTRLVSTPVEKSNSIYSRRESCVHVPTLIPLQVEFFKKGRKAPVKRLRARKLKKIQGYWTVLDSTMYDLKTGSQTKLATHDIRYDLEIPESLFTKQGLGDPGRGQQYLP